MDGATGDLCAWCFDLLELNGRGLRRRTLIERKAMLRHLLNKADDDVLRFSEPFQDPVKLLAAAESQGLEGISSSRNRIARARTRAGSRSSAALGARRTAINGNCLRGTKIAGFASTLDLNCDAQVCRRNFCH
jgi:hypothetical protein